MGARPAVVIGPLTTRLLDVLIKVTELERIEQNASGKSSLLGDVLVRAATPMSAKSTAIWKVMCWASFSRLPS
jgi:hypothetical protein